MHQNDLTSLQLTVMYNIATTTRLFDRNDLGTKDILSSPSPVCKAQAFALTSICRSKYHNDAEERSHRRTLFIEYYTVALRQAVHRLFHSVLYEVP